MSLNARQDLFCVNCHTFLSIMNGIRLLQAYPCINNSASVFQPLLFSVIYHTSCFLYFLHRCQCGFSLKKTDIRVLQMDPASWLLVRG